MLVPVGSISRDSTEFSVLRSVNHTGPSSRRNVRGASVLSGLNPGSHDMVNSINSTYTSLRLSTCFVPGPPCNDQSHSNDHNNPRGRWFFDPIFQVDKLRIRKVQRLAQGLGHKWGARIWALPV